MSDNFLAEIRIFPLNYAPMGWAQCNGQLISITQNAALFSLLGTTYGGDGRTNFALPNLQGYTTLGSGQGSGLTFRTLGEKSGTQTVTLNLNQIPLHNHSPLVKSGSTSVTPVGKTWGEAGTHKPPPNFYTTNPGTPPPALVAMNQQSLGLTGGNLPHNNLMPYLTLNYCIALQGVFPQRP
jgi:microcystin-dependent protein